MTPELLAAYRKTFGSMSTEELRAIVEGRKPHKLGEEALAAIRLLLAERKGGGHVEGALPAELAATSPVILNRTLTLDQLRDANENSALLVLYVLAIPVFVLILYLIVSYVVSTFGLGLIAIGMFWLASRMAQYFSAAHIKTNAVRVSEKQLPEVYRAVAQCSQQLGITPPDVYVMQHNVWNAFAAKLAGRRMIVLYSGAIDSILLKGDLQQLTWVAGHEIGHHAAGHLDFSRTLARLGGWAPWILLWYHRRAEFTCDRIALYCVGNRKTSLLALANMTVGAQLAEKVNVNAAIEDWEKYRTEFFVKYRTIYSTHPPHLWRLRQLCDAAVEFGID